jgi:hypothetical protein
MPWCTYHVSYRLVQAFRSWQEGYTYRHTDWWEGFMTYAIEMGSGVIVYIPSFIKIGLCIWKLIGGGGIHRQDGDCKCLLLFYQNIESRLTRTWLQRHCAEGSIPLPAPSPHISLPFPFHWAVMGWCHAIQLWREPVLSENVVGGEDTARWLLKQNFNVAYIRHKKLPLPCLTTHALLEKKTTMPFQ